MKSFITLQYTCQFKKELFPFTSVLPPLATLNSSAESKMSEQCNGDVITFW